MSPAGNASDAQASALSALRASIDAVSRLEISEPAQILLDAMREKFPDAAVLFYGSGASVAHTDDPANVIFDFYVIGESYDALYDSAALKLVNRAIPPNVFYFEAPSRFGVLRAKYAVLSIDHFERLTSAGAFHSYFWARFAQPCRIAAPNEVLVTRLQNALAWAVATFCARSAGLLGDKFTARQLWLAGLGASYKAELRAEDEARAGKLIDSYGDWTDDVTANGLTLAGIENESANGVITLKRGACADTRASWKVRAVQGAGLSVLRLLKGTQTFKGGIDYIAWKIHRHSGVDLQISDWERAHPMLAAPGAALRYYRLRAAKDKK